MMVLNEDLAETLRSSIVKRRKPSIFAQGALIKHGLGRHLIAVLDLDECATTCLYFLVRDVLLTQIFHNVPKRSESDVHNLSMT